MNAQEFEEYMVNVLMNWDEDQNMRSIRTFDDAGILTMDSGIVVRMQNGSEFQVTKVKSK